MADGSSIEYVTPGTEAYGLAQDIRARRQLREPGCLDGDDHAIPGVEPPFLGLIMDDRGNILPEPEDIAQAAEEMWGDLPGRSLDGRIPVLITVEQNVRFILTEGTYPSTDDVQAACMAVGRNNEPYLVATLWAEGYLLPQTAAVVVPAAWSGAECPQLAVDDDEWAELFYLAGYTVDGVPSARPSASVRLWRGAVPERRLGWSWTDDEGLAAWFADRDRCEGRGQVWVADVDPDRLLARITQERMGEPEYVVDTRGDGFSTDPEPPMAEVAVRGPRTLGR